MKVQPIANQPKFSGKVVFESGTTKELTQSVQRQLWQKYKEVATLIADKPYDLFISRNKQNAEFYDIAANKSMEEAQKVKEYSVKVQANIIQSSIVDAAKDAMEMYEKYISKSIKG